MVLFSGGAWEPWSEGGAAIGDGEWGVRANISYEAQELLIMFIGMVILHQWHLLWEMQCIQILDL